MNLEKVLEKQTGLELPYAVYGTLRSGEGNSRLWQGLARSGGLSTLRGYRLVSNGGFPYALFAGPKSEITVEAVVPNGDEASQFELRRRLDRLEGYPDFYDRYLETVVVEGAPQECWIYVPSSDHEELGKYPQVPNNDWKNKGEVKWD